MASTLSPVSRPFCGHDPQGKLTGIQRAAGERFLAKVDCLAALEAAMNIDVGRDFFDVARAFKDRDRRRCYVCKIGPRLREPLFTVCNRGYDFRSLGAKRGDRAYFCHAAEIGTGRPNFLWQLRHNTGQWPRCSEVQQGPTWRVIVKFRCNSQQCIEYYCSANNVSN